MKMRVKKPSIEQVAVFLSVFFSVWVLPALVGFQAKAEIQASKPKYKTIKIQEDKNRYQVDLSFPELLAGAVHGFETINSDLRNEVIQNGCDEPGAESEVSHSYESTVTLAEINKQYVTFEAWFSSYCGGAHPNHGRYFLTYNSVSGEKLNIESEFGFLDWQDPDYDLDKEHHLRLKLAEVVVDHIPADVDVDFECYGDTRDEKIEGLADFYVSVVGLNKSKTVTVMTHPPHAATPCRFSVDLKYSVIGPLLLGKSYLHQWLR